MVSNQGASSFNIPRAQHTRSGLRSCAALIAELLKRATSAGSAPAQSVPAGLGMTTVRSSPALIATAMIIGNPKARTEMIPVGRLGTVEEVAEIAVMLASNGYVTGQTINVNGGWYMS